MLSSALRLALTDPVAFAFAAGARVSPGIVHGRIESLAARAGLDRLWLILSFDCDTEEDIAVAWDVHSRLMDIGVAAAYAVPGALLRRGERVYRRIAETGAEFLNHGGCEHTYFDAEAGDYRSCFFYDRQPLSAVEADIVEGDAVVRDVIGRAPRGFRAPHFGTFQKPGHLAFLHDALRRVGYAYSSSTTPVHALRRGPAFRRNGLWELPITGRPGRPLSILDTWSCYRAPDRALGPDDYAHDAAALADAAAGRVGLLNLYADPSHIADQPSFFEAVRCWRSVAEPTDFTGLVARLEAGSRA